MKVSYNLLQTYFKEKLPAPEALAEALTFHAFEIESIEQKDADTVLDVKVLPDRARYALSHRGIAYELGAILNIPLMASTTFQPPLTPRGVVSNVTVCVEDSSMCSRYMARKIEGITINETPEWLKKSLETLRQKSINSVVDAANFVLLDLGQPLHVFDADNIVGNISVRFAKPGEKITTLDNKEITLDEGIVVIADDAGPLVIAGIKGGTRAEVTSNTKNIIIESANFNPSLIRKTSAKIGIRTDASKHYENAISPDLCAAGMEKITSLITTINTPASISEITDIYPHPVSPCTLSVSQEFINSRLGVSLDSKTIADILMILSLSYTISGTQFLITIPTWRGDLVIPEDIVEEIGRIYGYDKIPAQVLPDISVHFKPKILKSFYYAHKIRDVLVAHGFSEVYTYAFGSRGDIELEKPLAADKKYVRASLIPGVSKACELNAHNADLLELDAVKLFEIGAVITKNKDGSHEEQVHLCVAVKNIKKSKIKEADILQEAINSIRTGLGSIIPEIKSTIQDNIVEINFTELIKNLPEPEHDLVYPLATTIPVFKPISVYPFSVRDIAVFTPEGTEEKTVRDIIEYNASDLLVKNRLFDVFTKTLPDGTKKTSYAFRMVFQSFERTLTEQEINDVMKKITDVLNATEGYHVR